MNEVVTVRCEFWDLRSKPDSAAVTKNQFDRASNFDTFLMTTIENALHHLLPTVVSIPETLKSKASAIYAQSRRIPLRPDKEPS
jgi:hypothetical protein